MERYDVAVVGLGAMGAAALYALAKRGRRVIGIDRFRPGHDHGSSHGESRVIRLAYLEGPEYVPLVKAALPLWRELEQVSGASVFTNAGVLEMGVAGSANVASSLASARLHDLAHDVLTAREVAARFPAFAPPADWDCLFQPDGGVLEPKIAIRAFVETAERLSASVRIGAACARPRSSLSHVEITLGDGEPIQADSVIVAAGAWLPELYPELRPALTVTCQHLFWFASRSPELTTPDKMPAFVMDAAGRFIYGLPSLGHGVKAASHDPGPSLAQADDTRPEAAADVREAVSATLRDYAPGAAGPITATKSCLYTNTKDGHFVVGLHPREPKVVLASPCSGHGFKFATVMGEILADLATRGATDYPITLFAPERLNVW